MYVCVYGNFFHVWGRSEGLALQGSSGLGGIFPGIRVTDAHPESRAGLPGRPYRRAGAIQGTIKL